jgi:hypothetical protein
MIVLESYIKYVRRALMVFVVVLLLLIVLITRPGDLKSPGSCCELAPREAVSGL